MDSQKREQLKAKLKTRCKTMRENRLSKYGKESKEKLAESDKTENENNTNQQMN